MERYTPLAKRYTLLTQVQGGMNFMYKNNIMNEFSIGGMTPNFHNQITFAGLREGTFYSPSVAEVCWAYQLFSNVSIYGEGQCPVQ